MSTFHFLNVDLGDCMILEHATGHVSMYDICCGNLTELEQLANSLAAERSIPSAPGNFGMCRRPVNPLSYMKQYVGSSLFRFILSHPDMDHLDGFDRLVQECTPQNFWHSGVNRDKPAFGSGTPFKEEDWDRYEKVRDGNEPGVISLMKRAGARFKYANKNDDETPGGDGLYILAPDNGLVEAADLTGDYNDASYVILYRSLGGRILIPGDAHDKTWEYVLKEYESDITNVDLLVAPHHGRRSGRDYAFLDTVNPKLTLFGCAPSDALAYDAWNRRGLTHITNNQAGCIVVECYSGVMDVYVENARFAAAAGGDLSRTHRTTGFSYLGSIHSS